jgi:hypothetical protein
VLLESEHLRRALPSSMILGEIIKRRPPSSSPIHHATSSARRKLLPRCLHSGAVTNDSRPPSGRPSCRPTRPHAAPHSCRSTGPVSTSSTSALAPGQRTEEPLLCRC